MKVKIGIDNGTSGSIGIITEKEVFFTPTPTFKVLNYTKKKGNVTRVDVDKLKNILKKFSPKDCVVNIERPMVNPGRFKASVSAIRALEATCIALEQCNLGYKFIDSKEWQKKYLQEGIKGSAALKEASKLRGIQLYPHLRDIIERQKDADGLFLAMLD